ncbi:MAG: TetR/AcrR family transcriptional regulator [Candidatus Eremiobacteraeota bacterium]|nr:TetR/AcrR family transcriptional regulator [Candidatus Eremiobacteraeota bacterium]
MTQEKKTTRMRLLDAALDAFSEKGFDGASIREITRRVGIRESGFYAHFAGKRDAYDELLGEAGPAAAVRAMRALEKIDEPGDFFPALMHVAIEGWSAPRARKFLTLALRNAFVGEGNDWRAILHGVDNALSTLAPRIARWQNEGKMTAEVPAAQLAYLFMAPIAVVRIMFFNSAAGPQEAQRGQQMLDEHVRAFLLLSRNQT